MPSLKRGSRVARSSSSSGGEEEEVYSSSDSDNEEQIRLNDSLLNKVDQTYLNQPIDLKQGDTRLKVLIGNLKVLNDNLKDTIGLLHNVGSEFAESLVEEIPKEWNDFDEDKYIQFLLDNETMKSLDSEFRNVLDKFQENKIKTSIISDIRNRIVQSHKITNLYETYQAKADTALESYKSRSTRDKFLKDKEYVDFMTLIWENFASGRPMPNMKKFLPMSGGEQNGNGAQGGGNGEDSDSDVEMGAQSTDFRCPLSATILQDPYTSTECPHSFSGEDIKAHIRSNGGSVPCPVGGCPRVLTLQKIEKDDGLRRRVEAHLKRKDQGRVTQTQGGGGGDKSGGGGATNEKTYEELSDSDEE